MLLLRFINTDNVNRVLSNNTDCNVNVNSRLPYNHRVSISVLYQQNQRRSFPHPLFSAGRYSILLWLDIRIVAPLSASTPDIYQWHWVTRLARPFYYNFPFRSRFSGQFGRAIKHVATDSALYNHVVKSTRPVAHFLPSLSSLYPHWIYSSWATYMLTNNDDVTLCFVALRKER